VPARTPTTRPRGHLARGALIALLLHGQILVPLVIATFFLAHREEAERAEEVDVGFEDVKPEELPHDLPPLDDTPPPSEPAPRRRDQREKPAEADKRPKPEKPPEPTPTKPPEVQAEKPPQPPAPPAPPPPAPNPKLHEKSVDLDNDKDVEAPKDAKLLAQKNNRAEVETRAEKTNLEREQKGEEASATDKPSPPDEAQKSPGDSKNKIAELDDVKSKAGRAAPEDTPHTDPDSAPTPENQPLRSPVLSLRSVAPRGHEITPETVDPSLPRDPAGILAAPTRRGAFADDEADRAHSRSGKRIRLALSGKDYEYLFGAESKADRQLAEKVRSTRMGKFARRTAQIRSALENFLPEVRPGNQTALNTRAAPFAAFIARMHRNIHKLWGFGALEEWDELPRSSPFNNEALLTTVEIVLGGDGSIDKVSVIQPSGYVAYDAAAVDTVYSAGPYPEPPSVIRSGNGKIYIHWRFFRDGRQCATSGVDYFILNNAEAMADGQRSGAGAAAPDAPGGARGGGRASSSLETAPGRGVALAPAPGGGPTAQQPLVNPPQVLPDQNAGARVARAWFASYTRGDVDGLTSTAVFPFRTSLTGTVKSRDELADLLRGLLAESPHRAIGSVSVDTGGGLRRQMGKLPSGLDDGSGALFALAEADGDKLVLVLKKTQRGWQPQGLIRL